jgi:hypoxanthine phosphoribosyltransferase
MAIDPARLALPRLPLELTEFNGMCVELADIVEADCVENGTRFDLMGVLPRGSFAVADVMSRRLGFSALEIVSQSQTSYEHGKTVAGKRHFGQTITGQLVEGMDILVVDDTSDTDETLAQFKRIAFDLGAKSVKTAVIVYKPERNTTGQVPDYYLFEYNGWIDFPSEIHDAVGETSVACRANILRREAARQRAEAEA